MKKRIWLILLAIVIIVGIAFLVFRHEIIGHALKISISKKTNQTVDFNIGQIHYDILNSTVTFLDSDFSFNNIYINKTKTIELSKLKFDAISIEGLSLFKLLFKSEVVAKKFSVAKPSLWFKENDNPEPFKERPKEVIKSLKEHPDLLGDLVIIVDEIEITHGKVDLKSLIDAENHSGSVMFKLVLRNFNTSKEQIFNEDRFLFAKEHFFKLSNFIYSLPNGDQIRFDSIVFGSEYDGLQISNIGADIQNDSLYPGIESINLQVNELLVAGIDFEDITKFHDIDIEHINLSQADINIVTNEKLDVSSSSKSSKKEDSNFKKFLNSINLDTLTLSNINLLAKNISGDTIVELKTMNFEVNDIVIDSSVMASKSPKLDFESINLQIAEFILYKKTMGLDVSFNNLSFDEIDKIISLSNLHFDDKVEGKHSYYADVDLVELSGASIQDYLNKDFMKIGVNISNAVTNIDIIEVQNRKATNKKPSILKYEINEINIFNGNFYFTKGDKLKLDISGLNMNSGQIQLGDFNNIHEINTDNLTLNLAKIDFALPEKELNIETGSLAILDNNLNLKNVVSSFYDSDNKKTSLLINQLQLNDFNFAKVVNLNEIDIAEIKIIKPYIVGGFDIRNSNSSNSTKNPEDIFPYKIVIGDFELINGKVEFEIASNNGPIDINSGFNVTTSNIVIPNIHDNIWINKIGWDINLTNGEVVYLDYLIGFKKFVSDKNKGTLAINSLLVKDKNIDSESKVKIVDFSLNKLDLEGFNYNSLFDKTEPVASSLTITKPNINLIIDNRKEKTNNSDQSSNSKFKMPFVLDELIVDNLSLILEKRDSLSTSNLSLGELDFSYQLDSSSNLTQDIDYLTLNNFQFSDSTKNTFSRIGKIHFKKVDNSIDISNIEGGNINRRVEDENHMTYFSSGVGISNINVSNSSPYQIAIGDIDLLDFNIEIENDSTKRKKTTKFQHNNFKLPNLLRSIDINTVRGSNIDFSHSTISGVKKKEMSLNNLGFSINGISIDSSTLAADHDSLVSSLSLNLRGNKFVSKDSLYSTSIVSVNYDFTKNMLSVDSLMMKPRYNADEFFKKAVYQTGKMDIVAGNIVCSDFRIKELINEGSIHIGAVDVYDLSAVIFRNKLYEMNPNEYKKMPQEALMSVPRLLIIDSLKTHNTYIKYRQLSKKSVVPGEIFLNKFNLSIFNVNNDKSLLDTNSNMVAKLNAMLLGEAALKLEVRFPLLSKSDDYMVSGSISNLDFTKLNSMTQNLAGITMMRGIGGVEIPMIKGNNEFSDGSIFFKYKKLKIELYDRENAKNTSGLTGSMANLLLNDIFIKSNNPGFLGKTREGEVYFKRNTQKSIVFNIWKSVFSGIMSTMGYNNKEQRQENRARRRLKKKS